MRKDFGSFMGKIWVTGGNGQLGSQLRELTNDNSDWIFTDLPILDICNEQACRKFVVEHNVDTILHCAAYTAVDRAESEPELAFLINTQATLQLAQIAKEANARFIFISTDYVFDGNRQHPYTESDDCAPLSVYGKTKREAETGIQQIGVRGITVRTAWLYSRYGNNFVKTMLRLAEERPQLQVIADQLGSPTYAKDLAQALIGIIPQLENTPFRGEIFHFSNEGTCSWYELAKTTLEFGHKTCPVQPIRTEQYPTAAARPKYSVLSKEKIRNTFQVRVPDWKESLAEFLQTFPQ